MCLIYPTFWGSECFLTTCNSVWWRWNTQVCRVNVPSSIMFNGETVLLHVGSLYTCISFVLEKVGRPPVTLKYEQSKCIRCLYKKTRCLLLAIYLLDLTARHQVMFKGSSTITNLSKLLIKVGVTAAKGVRSSPSNPLPPLHMGLIC